MIRVLTVVITLALVGAMGAYGQDAAALPANAAFAGLGFQKTSNPTTSGWAEGCHRNPDVKLAGLTLPSYACLATDYLGNATSARVDLDTVLIHRGWFAGGIKTGGGAAVSGSGVGGSFAGGAWGTLDVSKFTGMTGSKLAASVTWQKDDVMVVVQQAGLPAQFQSLASRATFRFGVGKTW